MKLYKGKKPVLLDVEKASSFLKRLTGLLGKTEVPERYAMYFPHCNSIHTFFMKIRIDVVMTDDKSAVVRVFKDLGPWKIASCPDAKDTYELRAGSAASLNIKKGDILKLM